MSKPSKMKIKKWKKYQRVAVENAVRAIDALEESGVGIMVATNPNKLSQLHAYSFKNQALMSALIDANDEVSLREKASMEIPLRALDETEAEFLANIPAKQLARARAHRLINDHQIAGDGSPLIEAKRRAIDRSLLEFTREAWRIIEPGSSFVEGWHLEAICEHLEACSDGQIKRLLINMPPRHGMSSLLNVMWFCWNWARDPSSNWFFTSYSPNLSLRDSLKCRRILQSEWFQREYGDVLVKRDPRSKGELRSQNGLRSVVPIGCGACGDSADFIVADTPQKCDEPNGVAALYDWWTKTMSTRLSNKDGVMVVASQRLGSCDFSAEILKSDLGYEHLYLPMKWNKDCSVVTNSIEFLDPRFSSPYGVIPCGDEAMLWPQRFDAQTWEKMVGEIGWAEADFVLQQGLPHLIEKVGEVNDER